MRMWTEKVNAVSMAALQAADYSPFTIPSWHGDNRRFVVELLLPAINPRDEVWHVIRWAYGYDGGWDGQGSSFEALSDGSTVVPDVWMGGFLKEPFAVAHDMIFEWHRLRMRDPTGRRWSLWASNVWYMRAMVDFGMPVRGAWRFVGLTLGGWTLWVNWNELCRTATPEL